VNVVVISGKKKREYLRAKLKEIETNSKNKIIRGSSDFKKGYQPRSSTVTDDKGDLVADSHSILGRWKNYFNYSMCMGIMMLGRLKNYTAEPLVPEPSAFEVEIPIEKLKRCKSPGIDQIPAHLIEAGGMKICSKIHKLINCIWNKKELPEQ
jgi:hypothetical protein